MMNEALTWALSDVGKEPPAEYYCPTRDIADGRLPKLMAAAREVGFSDEHAPLIAALTGELTANCFDHNLGSWRDISGCWLSFTPCDGGLVIFVADRGQGILSSLRNADPRLSSDRDALVTALTKRLSGRHPENRGRGLKFTLASLETTFAASTFHLFSGDAQFKASFPNGISDLAAHVQDGQEEVRGTYAMLDLRPSIQ